MGPSFIQRHGLSSVAPQQQEVFTNDSAAHISCPVFMFNKISATKTPRPPIISISRSPVWCPTFICSSKISRNCSNSSKGTDSATFCKY